LRSSGGESSKVLGSKGGLKLDPLGFYTGVADMELSGSLDLRGAEFRFHSVEPDYNGFDSPQKHWIASLQGRVSPIWRSIPPNWR
jgi:hypothetical protein